MSQTFGLEFSMPVFSIALPVWNINLLIRSFLWTFSSIPVWNYMIKVNNRNSRTRCKILLTFNIFQPCSSISIVNFEQVNIGWDGRWEWGSVTVWVTCRDILICNKKYFLLGLHWHSEPCQRSTMELFAKKS